MAAAATIGSWGVRAFWERPLTPILAALLSCGGQSAAPVPFADPPMLCQTEVGIDGEERLAVVEPVFTRVLGDGPALWIEGEALRPVAVPGGPDVAEDEGLEAYLARGRGGPVTVMIAADAPATRVAEGLRLVVDTGYSQVHLVARSKRGQGVEGLPDPVYGAELAGRLEALDPAARSALVAGEWNEALASCPGSRAIVDEIEQMPPAMRCGAVTEALMPELVACGPGAVKRVGTLVSLEDALTVDKVIWEVWPSPFAPPTTVPADATWQSIAPRWVPAEVEQRVDVWLVVE